MKILAPLGSGAAIDPLVKAGVDELYLGFDDTEWRERFSDFADINRMSGFKSRANFSSFAETCRAVEKIKSIGKAAFVTLNANVYDEAQIDFLRSRYFPGLTDSGVDGVIVSAPNIVIAALEFGLKPILSTMCSVYNVDMAGYYRSLGVRRMILPRDLTLDEIGDICRVFPDVQFEAFFMRNGCVFSDGYCLGFHRPECGALCHFIRHKKYRTLLRSKTFKQCHDIEINNFIYDNAFHNDACAMCALYRLAALGVGALKIVGRADDIKSLIEDVALTRQNLVILKGCSSEDEYLDRMKFPRTFPALCRMGLCCYYPEIRFNSNR